jgi:hypothetical protein
VRTIDIKSAVRPLADYAAESGRGVLVVTSGRKPVAAVVSLADVDAESLALSASVEFAKIIERARGEFERGETLTMDEMEAATLGSGKAGRVAEGRGRYVARRRKGG